MAQCGGSYSGRVSRIGLGSEEGRIVVVGVIELVAVVGQLWWRWGWRRLGRVTGEEGGGGDD